jgi:rRNA maturation protein Nop10
MLVALLLSSKGVAVARVDELYQEAETLAKFSNIDPMDTDPLSPTNVENFRNNYSDFFPAALWDTHALSVPPGGGAVLREIVGPSTPAWLLHQKLVRDAWQNKFELDSCVLQITNIGQLSKLEKAVAEIAQMLRKSNVIPTYTLPESEVWPCQRAAMFLGVDSWRVRFCSSCGNRYVAAHPRQQFCGDNCFQKSRKEAKKAWWGEHGQNWRTSKQKSAKKISKTKKENA